MALAELIIFSINSSFFTIANIFMSKEGIADPQIATYWSVRFASTLFFAVPFGIFIKGRKLKPLFFIDAIVFALSAISFVYAVSWNNTWQIYLSFIFMGLGDSATRILSISYILRNVAPENHTLGISLNSATWSTSLITSGMFIAFFNTIDPVFFNEELLLKLLGGIGLLSVFFIFRMTDKEVIPNFDNNSKFSLNNYNWKSIGLASIPTILIATGAGLTIPFVNLFFFNSFGVESNQFAMIMILVAGMVSLSILYVPNIKERYGYKAITITQSLSVIALFGMATTDFFNHIEGMVFIAILCFVLRQPLMNLAGPMTSEMTMYYVGKESQELMASLTSTIWSGSWFISSMIFRALRSADFMYGSIFYITVILYIFGISAYHLLIQDFNRKKEAGLIEIV